MEPSRENNFGFLRILFATAVVFSHSFPPTFLEHPTSINGPLWTIKIEFECYLVVAVLGILGLFRRRSLPLTLFVVMALIAGAIHSGPGAEWIAHHLSPDGQQSVTEKTRLLAYFLGGMTFWLYREKIKFTRGGIIAAITITIAATVVGLLAAVLPFAGTYLLFSAAYSKGTFLRRFGSRYDLSYGTYLYGWPVQLLVVHWATREIGPYVLFILATAGAYTLAFASWVLVERPALALKKRPPVLELDTERPLQAAP